MKRLLYLAFLLPSLLSAQAPYAGIISPARATRWDQNAGIAGNSSAGTLPSSSWGQCGSTIAAYGTSGSYASPSTIISAVAACSGSSQYVQLGSGDFYLNASIHLSGMQKVELRGMGPQNTRLHFNGTVNCSGGFGACFVDFASSDTTYPSSGTPYFNWTGGYSQGATSITVTAGTDSISSLAVGKAIYLDQLDDSSSFPGSTSFWNCAGKYSGSQTTWSGSSGCTENGPENVMERPTRGQQEMAIIMSCSPTCGTGSGTITVNLSVPLIHPNWSSGFTPQAFLMSPSASVGFQGFSMDGTGFSTGGALPFALSLFNTVNSWVRNVQISNTPNASMYIFGGTNNDIQSNYMYAIGQANPSNDSAGINWAALHNSVIQNNIIHKGKVALFPIGPESGNVIAGNFTINSQTGDYYLFGNCWQGHSNGSDLNLWEGNYCNQLLWDQTHGTQLANTDYRNFLSGWESCSNGPCGSYTQKTSQVDALELNGPVSRYTNHVGNVEATPGIATVAYQRQNQQGYQWGGSGTGYAENVGSGNTGITNVFTFDSYVIGSGGILGTVMEYGNWDAFSNATLCNSSQVPTGISPYPNSVPSTCPSSSSWPASFYFPSRPAYWSSSIPFPAVGPDVSGGNVGQCGGTPNASGQYALVAASNASQCASQGLTSAWSGHVNAFPAMACYFSLGGKPDGTGTILLFDANGCYGASTGVSLTVSTAGSGTGNITGTNCATGSYSSGTSIGPCTATATGGSTFTGWSSTGSASCSGTGTCPASGSFSLTATTTLTATFTGGTSTCGDPFQNSPNFSGTYNVPPTVIPLAIGFTSSTSGCTMVMTLNGSVPNSGCTISGSTVAYANQNISATTAVRVRACQAGFVDSNVIGGLWTLNFITSGVSISTGVTLKGNAGVQ